jgi:DNA-binding LytR/AlgR family response regulator
METQFRKADMIYRSHQLAVVSDEFADAIKNNGGSENYFHGNRQASNETLPVTVTQKKSFLVFKHNKYITVATDTIAFFYVKYESSIIVTFNRQEFFVDYSLEHIQNRVSDQQFYRLNRQYLINFSAVKEVEHYFARKLLVNLIVPVAEKLLVSKEKATGFLGWLENR